MFVECGSQQPTEKEPASSSQLRQSLAEPRENDDDNPPGPLSVLKRQWVAGFEAPGFNSTPAVKPEVTYGCRSFR